MSEEPSTEGRHLTGGALCTGVLLALVLFDPDHRFEWLLARLLGLSLSWLGWGAFLWARRQPWWSPFFTWGLAAEVVVRILDLTPVRWIPPLLLALWLAPVVIPLLFAGGIREAIKDRRDLTPAQSMVVSLAAGALIHHMVVTSVVAGILTLLRGRYA